MMRRDQPEKISCKTRTHSQTTRQHKKLVDKLHVRKSFQNGWPKSGKICIQCTQIFPIWKDLHWKDLRPPTVVYDQFSNRNRNLLKVNTKITHL